MALVNWPNAENRALGLVVAELEEPETGRELATVFLPNTPDPTKGAIRVVGAEGLQPTDWDLSDLARWKPRPSRCAIACRGYPIPARRPLLKGQMRKRQGQAMLSAVHSRNSATWSHGQTTGMLEFCRESDH